MTKIKETLRSISFYKIDRYADKKLKLSGVSAAADTGKLRNYLSDNPAQARMSWASRRILSRAITGYTQISKM